MASIRTRKDSGCLLLDFRFQGTRYREQTLLLDTPANRARLEKLGQRIERAISQGVFRFADFFPDSKHASPTEAVRLPPPTPASPEDRGPTVEEFAETWYRESQVRWRKRYRQAVRETLDRIILPRFAAMRLAEVTRADVLGFRADIAERPGRGKSKLSPVRINKIMQFLRSIFDEGCMRLGKPSPTLGIKPLRAQAPRILPFSLPEVGLLIDTVRADYRDYLVVRLFTGLRTGEANGLQWGDMDFESGVIHITRTHSRQGDGETKTQLSRRDVPMLGPVRRALEERMPRRDPATPWVFTTPEGTQPIDEVNFTNRVWYPLLRHLGLENRPPYQMRHTAATLMLASGENPEWVARVLGHANTEMLFRVYSRYIPNLTRRDGGAYDGLLRQHLVEGSAACVATNAKGARINA